MIAISVPLIQLKQMLRIAHTHPPIFIVCTNTRSRISAYKFGAYRAEGKKRTFKSTNTLPPKSLRFYFWQLKLIGHQTVDPPFAIAHTRDARGDAKRVLHLFVYLCRTYLMDFIQPLLNVIDELCAAYKSQHFEIHSRLKCFKKIISTI